MWPWKSEKRESSYTDALISQIVSQASGATLAKPAATGALEASAIYRRDVSRRRT